MLRCVRAESAPLERTATSHLTGSAAVLDATGTHVLLTLHRRFGRWLQLGGHCDGDANLAGTALREAVEESGLDGLRIHPVPIDVDIHAVPCPPATGGRHLDVRFLVVAPTRAEPSVTDESVAVSWFDVDDLPADFDAGGHRLVAAARRAWAEIG